MNAYEKIWLVLILFGCPCAEQEMLPVGGVKCVASAVKWGQCQIAMYLSLSVQPVSVYESNFIWTYYALWVGTVSLCAIPCYCPETRRWWNIQPVISYSWFIACKELVSVWWLCFAKSSHIYFSGTRITVGDYMKLMHMYMYNIWHIHSVVCSRLLPSDCNIL